VCCARFHLFSQSSYFWFVRTPYTNPCARQGLTYQQKNVNMLKHLLSKGGHTPARIFSNPFPHSRVVSNNESAIQEVLEEPKIHEHIPQEEDLEVSSSSYCE
jgi:hypothetical protein